MTTAIICSSLLAALVFVLGANVTRNRVITGKAGGDQQPRDPASKLLIAVRAHGNAAEYIPVLVVLFLLVGYRSPAWVAIPLIIVATAARLLHAYGMLTSTTLAMPGKSREIGAGMTYLSGVALAVAAVASL
ncbi:MAG TPA: MAPEG family protein [Propionibacteriaceae bacterium]|nr:MAPEG family protein [Propionibacteriaceae bacterium]